jgi:hypothetical protein
VANVADSKPHQHLQNHVLQPGGYGTLQKRSALYATHHHWQLSVHTPKYPFSPNSGSTCWYVMGAKPLSPVEGYIGSRWMLPIAPEAAATQRCSTVHHSRHLPAQLAGQGTAPCLQGCLQVGDNACRPCKLWYSSHGNSDTQWAACLATSSVLAEAGRLVCPAGLKATVILYRRHWLPLLCLCIIRRLGH